GAGAISGAVLGAAAGGPVGSVAGAVGGGMLGAAAGDSAKHFGEDTDATDDLTTAPSAYNNPLSTGDAADNNYGDTVASRGIGNDMPGTGVDTGTVTGSGYGSSPDTRGIG